MDKQFANAITLLKEQKHINGCIAGSAMLGYQEGWNQDIDVFCYDEQSFTALLYFMHYNPMFNILDKLELHKFEDYTRNNKSSLSSIGLITIKFSFNLCIPINVIYKKFQNNIFDVISAFDNDLIAQGYCLKTGKVLSLRESTGTTVDYNRWNPTYYTSDFWSIKRLLRQFQRCVKYTERGYDLTLVTDKYISIIKEIIQTENFYKSDKGTKYFNDTIEQFEVVLKILQVWKKELKITPEQLLILNTLI
jgi:hypothetical protein